MSKIILKVNNLDKVFFSKGMELKAVNNLSFEIKKGETIGIVGESGCGKSTLGRCIVNSIRATSGDIFYNSSENMEYNIAKINKKNLKKIRKEIQLIFQDPYSSLNPRMSVFDIISEPLKVNYKLPKREVENRVKSMAKRVGLNPSYLKRYPHAFSGGQRQRIGIARALIFEPEFIVCDEAVSALDVSVQAQVLNLLKELQNELGLTYLFISHDLSVVEYIADKIGVMYLGKLMEYAATEEMFKKPLHPYTEALLSAVLIADPNLENLNIPLKGDIPNPAHPPGGCFFHTRCKYRVEKCKTESVELIEYKEGHSAACHRVDELNLKGLI